jgi:hypothetical protein
LPDGPKVIHSMELDQRNLQFFINVIAIAGIASFAPIFYLLKWDKQQPMKKRLSSHASDPRPNAVVRREPVLQRELSAPAQMKIDIRQYVAHRSHTWVAPTAEQWNGSAAVSACR